MHAENMNLQAGRPVGREPIAAALLDTGREGAGKAMKHGY